jgi:hypothetical protein
MQHQEHDRHEADGEHQEGDDGPLFRFAETPGDDLDCRHDADKPEYGGEGYRGDDPDNEDCSPPGERLKERLSPGAESSCISYRCNAANGVA